MLAGIIGWQCCISSGVLAGQLLLGVSVGCLSSLNFSHSTLNSVDFLARGAVKEDAMQGADTDTDTDTDTGNALPAADQSALRPKQAYDPSRPSPADVVRGAAVEDLEICYRRTAVVSGH